MQLTVIKVASCDHTCYEYCAMGRWEEAWIRTHSIIRTWNVATRLLQKKEREKNYKKVNRLIICVLCTGSFNRYISFKSTFMSVLTMTCMHSIQVKNIKNKTTLAGTPKDSKVYINMQSKLLNSSQNGSVLPYLESVPCSVTAYYASGLQIGNFPMCFSCIKCS